MTPAEIAQELGISRPIIYRLLNTLADRHLATPVNGAYRLGIGLASLGRSVGAGLRTAATEELVKLANDFEATVILDVAEGNDAICLATQEPAGRISGCVIHRGFGIPST